MKLRTRICLIVIACVAALIALVAISITPAFVRASAAGRQASTKAMLTTTALAIHNYYRDIGQWPASLDDLQKNSKGIVYIEWGKYPKQDAWRHALVYKSFDSALGYGLISSYGADGKPGGTGLDEDLESRFGVDFPTWEQIQTNKPNHTLELTAPRADARFAAAQFYRTKHA